MPTTSEKLTRLKHLSALAQRTKAELTALDNKIAEIVTVGGQPNIIEEIQINGVKQNPSGKIVNLIIATKLSELTNDPGFQTSAEVQALVNSAIEALKIGEYAKAAELTALATRVKTIEDDYLKGADKTELQGNIDTVSGKVTTLVGEDVNKSVRAIAAEELAKQLITADAKEAMDTLAEIAAWIQSHPEDAASMHEAITALQSKVDTGEMTVSAYVADAIAALKIGDYATVEAMNALAARVKTIEDDYLKAADKYDDTDVKARIKAIEDDYLKGADKTALEKSITDGDAATLGSAKTYADEKAGAAETNAKAYADGLAKNYDATGSAAQALVDAKSYADGLAKNYDAAGAAATAESNAKAYTDGLIATDEEVDAALTTVFGAQA